MEITELIREGKNVLDWEEYKEAKPAWNVWCEDIERFIAKGQLSPEQVQGLKVKMHFVENEYSQIDSRTALRDAVDKIVSYLQTLCEDRACDLQESAAMQLIEKVLGNFHLYLRAMYQAPVHGKGTLKQNDLQRIVIGNEYDVQRNWEQMHFFIRLKICLCEI